MRVLSIIYRIPNSLISCLDYTQIMFCSSGNGLKEHIKFHYKSRYNNEEQTQILRTLNESTAKELCRFDISRVRVESIKKFCNKQGNFNNLDQVLEVEGLGVKILERLCDSILAFPTAVNNLLQNNDESIKVTNEEEKKLNKIQMLTPSMETHKRNALKTVVGVHIGRDTISWANLDRDGRLLTWDLLDVPFGAKKVHPTTLLEMVLKIRCHLPKGDVYIMEDIRYPVKLTQQQMGTLSTNLQHWQLKAMLLTVLNTCINDNMSSLPKKEGQTVSHCHQVYFLRSRLPARLFRLVVGSEKVSAQTVVTEILEKSPNKTTSDICYTPITVDSDLQYAYIARKNVDKEHLCQALLLTMTFMDLIVHMTPQSIKRVTGRK